MRFLSIVALLVLGCSDSTGGTAAGGLGQACYPNNTCNTGLECVRGFCNPPADTTSDDTTPGDTTPVDTAGDTGNEVGDTTPTETAVDTGEVDVGPPSISPLTGVNTNVVVTTPNPNPACDSSEVDLGSYGATYPWGGLEAGGQDYTCNRCPSGLPDFQGKWRYHGFAADGVTPDYDEGADATKGATEALFIDGNTWYSHFQDPLVGQSYESRGWFFCAQQPEHPNEHYFWVPLEAQAPFGDIDESDVVLSSGADNRLIAWFDEVGAQTNVQIPYCRIGSVRDGQTCNDPFDDPPRPAQYFAVIVTDAQIFPTHRADGADPCATATSPYNLHGADIDAVGLFDGADLVGYFDVVDYMEGGLCPNKPNSMTDPDEAKGVPDATLLEDFVSLGGGWLIGEFQGQPEILDGDTLVVYEAGTNCGPDTTCGGIDEGYEVFVARDIDCVNRGPYPYGSCALKLTSDAKGEATIPVSGF